MGIFSPISSWLMSGSGEVSFRSPWFALPGDTLTPGVNSEAAGKAAPPLDLFDVFEKPKGLVLVQDPVLRRIAPGPEHLRAGGVHDHPPAPKPSAPQRKSRPGRRLVVTSPRSAPLTLRVSRYASEPATGIIQGMDPSVMTPGLEPIVTPQSLHVLPFLMTEVSMRERGRQPVVLGSFLDLCVELRPTMAYSPAGPRNVVFHMRRGMYCVGWLGGRQPVCSVPRASTVSAAPSLVVLSSAFQRRSEGDFEGAIK